jgi:hypothetical protein
MSHLLFHKIKSLRKQLIIWLYEDSQRLYASLFKSYNSWSITKTNLLHLPKSTLGRHLSEFLDKKNFELIPNGECHDRYHFLCGFSTVFKNEIALQCLCYSDGKSSPYLYGAIRLEVVILPGYYIYYYKSHKTRRRSNPFHHFDYKKLLKVSINDFRSPTLPRSVLSKSKLSNS